MKQFFQTILTVLIGLFAGLALAGLAYLTSRQPSGEPVLLQASPTPPPIAVFVIGAVERPGVYYLPRESRLVDAVAMAGGFLEGADVVGSNLAQKLEDGAKIEIPGTGAFPTPRLVIGGDGILVTPTPPAGELVNINTADAALLDQLPGIGPSTAAAIVQYRLENGPFTRIEDLLKIPGLGTTTLDQIRGLITIGS